MRGGHGWAKLLVGLALLLPTARRRLPIRPLLQGARDQRQRFEIARLQSREQFPSIAIPRHQGGLLVQQFCEQCLRFSISSRRISRPSNSSKSNAQCTALGSALAIQIFIHPFSSFPPLNAIKKIAHTAALAFMRLGLELVPQFIKCLFCPLIQMVADFQFHFGKLRIGFLIQSFAAWMTSRLIPGKMQ